MRFSWQSFIDRYRIKASFAGVMVMASVALLLCLVMVMIGTRAGLLSVATGFEGLTLTVAPPVAAALAALSLISLGLAVLRRRWGQAAWAFGAFSITAALLLGYQAYRQALIQSPQVADVATGWQPPVAFSDKLMAARGPAARPLADPAAVAAGSGGGVTGQSRVDVNVEACPGAQPITPVSTDEDDVAEVLKQNGFQVFSRLPWRVEGTYQDDLYGFRYDVVVRIDPTRIDVRAVSRQNFPDLGATCRFVTDIVAGIKAR